MTSPTLPASQLTAAELQQIIEAALLVSPEPLAIERLQGLFADEPPDRVTLRAALERLRDACADRGYELVHVASGYRFQVRQSLSPWIGRLYAERPARYSRALLETLSLIAYRQPVTRGDIEDVRGVAVSTSIMRTLLDRGWIHVVGQREVPGRPALYGTTREFLDYFNLRALDDLPALERLADQEAYPESLQLSLSLPDDDRADVAPAIGSETPEPASEQLHETADSGADAAAASDAAADGRRGEPCG